MDHFRVATSNRETPGEPSHVTSHMTWRREGEIIPTPPLFFFFVFFFKSQFIRVAAPQARYIIKDYLPSKGRVALKGCLQIATERS